MASIRKNISWNLLGNILPLAVGLVIFPLIISAYGTERFGLLALAWSLVGYFSLFDMGLSRALTQMVSERLSKQVDNAEIAEMIRTSFRVMWLLGLVGGSVLWLIVPWLVRDMLKISSALNHEAIQAFSILAFSIPLVVHTSALRGVLDALQLFKQASLIRIVLGVGTFVGPYIASLFGASLIYAAYSLVLVRVISWVMHFYVVHNTVLLKTKSLNYHGKWLKPLFSFGGWMTVSNVIGPLMVYLDRFVIAAIIGASAVAYYVAPYEVVTKMWAVPAAISGVLFPLFAKEWQTNPITSAKFLNQGVTYVLIFLYPPVLFMSLFAHEWLLIWLNKEFSVNGAVIVGWLAAGVLVNSVAQIIFAKVQGAGRADWTAKLHMLEVIPYLLILWFALKQFGIAGAAFAWFLRVTVDMFGLVYAAGKLNANNLGALTKPLLLTMFGVVPLIVSIYIQSLPIRSMLALVVFGAYLIISVQRLRSDNVIIFLKSYFK